MRHHLGILFLLAASAVARASDLAVTPVVCSGGKLILDVGIGEKECACIFASARGAGGTRRLANIAGTFRLEDPLVYLGVVQGPRRVELRVPRHMAGTYLWWQALVLGERPRFSNVALGAIVSVGIERRSQPRPPQLEATVNAGQWLSLAAAIAPPEFADGARFQWTVEGAHVRDYVDRTHDGFSTIPMRPDDYTKQGIELYWRSDASQAHPKRGGPVDRRLAVEVTLAPGPRCKVTRVLRLERNATSVDLQAEDFYCQYNHRAPGPGLPPTSVLNQHAQWHIDHDWLLFPLCGPQVRLYANFLHHHQHMVELFGKWRAFFGYPPLVEWDPGTPIPRGIEIDHAGRKSSDPKYTLPTYLTVAGGTKQSQCFKRRKLGEFRDIAELSVDLNDPWHLGVHFQVGGDMASTRSSPKDPVFWRFHVFIEAIHQRWHQK